MSIAERKALVEREDNKISVSEQAELLELNRSGLYYKAAAPTEDDLRIKRMIDEIYTEHPEFGYRRICVWLNINRDLSINHKAVYRHMREMGIQAVYSMSSVSKCQTNAVR